MEKDFHYYLIYSILRATGFEENEERAEVIAHASQFVDENTEGPYLIDHDLRVFLPQRVESNLGCFYPIMTQSISTKSFNPYVQKYVYVPFHFLPGDNCVEIRGRDNEIMKNRLSTTPNSQNAKKLLHNAIKSNNPYQVGIALHTFADTWSHQNFSGLREDWNSVYEWYRSFKSIAPNIGHAELVHAPDMISARWTDFRFEEPKNKFIDNRERGLEATEVIYRELTVNSTSGLRWSDVRKSYDEIIGAKDYSDRKEKIGQFLQENGFGHRPSYPKNNWLMEAIDLKKTKSTQKKKGRGFIVKSEFTNGHWYRFHQAAKMHFAYAINLIKEL
jgi:hypothetical protein